MPKFSYRIRAKKFGALGAWQLFEGEIEGNDRDDAHLKLYDTYEHIHGWQLTEIRDICPSRDDAQPHIFENGRCVLCLKPVE